MTEGEAKGKRCCVPGCGWPLQAKTGCSWPYVDGYCIGSDCMAWRWMQGMCTDPGVALPEEGYCGLAGAP